MSAILRDRFRHLKIVFLLQAIIPAFVSSVAMAQEEYPSFEEMKAKYPKEHVVMLEDVKTFNVKRNGGLYLEEIVCEVYMILDETGVSEYTKQKIESVKSEQIKNIRAYSVNPSGKKRVVTDFSTTDVLSDGNVFYDGSKETIFSYPGLVVGSIRYLTYTREIDEERFPALHFFTASVPVLKSSFIMTTDDAVSMKYQLMNANENQFRYTTSISSSGTTYQWETDSVYRYKYEPNAPGALTYLPHVIAQVSSYERNGKTVNLLTNVADLHHWYEENIREVENEVPSDDLSRIADSLTKNSGSELEKVKAIYYWVQNNIKYIAFEEGINGFVPRQPSNVLYKRYGDCKDMAAIIYSMLKAVHIEGNLTWVGTRDVPYKYEEFPSAVVDNHMIATYKSNGKVYVLDATNPFQPIDFPSSFIQGKEVLIHYGADNFLVYQLPIEPPSASQINDSTFLYLHSTTMTGLTTVSYSGYHHVDLFHMLNDADEATRSQRMGKVFQKGNNSFTLFGLRSENLADRSQDLKVDYDFTVQNYITSTQKDLFLNLVIDKTAIEIIDMRNRTLPIEFDNCSQQTYTTILEVPEGYVISALPKNTTYSSNAVDYSVMYTVSGNQIICQTKLTIKQIVVQPDQFAAWISFQNERERSLAQRLILSKKQ